MHRLDPIFINSPENIADNRRDAEAELARLRARRSEADDLLTAAREDLQQCLDSVSRAIAREKSFLEYKGDIVDGEIAAPYELYEESVKRFRAAQANAQNIDSLIEDQLAMLADDELWKGDAA